MKAGMARTRSTALAAIAIRVFCDNAAGFILGAALGLYY